MFTTLSHDDYRIALEILSKSSQHPYFIEEIFYEKILKRLKNKTSFLDVGAGTGIVTKRLASNFKNTTIVEPNRSFFPQYANKNYNVIANDFLKCSLKKSYDFILCSHVMYHMPFQYMRAFINKLIQSLNSGGICLLSLMAPRGQNHLLHIEFNKKYINSTQIFNILELENIPFEICKKKNYFFTNTFEEMFTLCRFFVYEDCISKEFLTSFSLEDFVILENKIKNFVQNLNKEVKYQITQEEDYFIISASDTRCVRITHEKI